MTKPLILTAMLLLTVIAGCVLYVAVAGASSNRAERNHQINACVQRELAGGPPWRACMSD